MFSRMIESTGIICIHCGARLELHLGCDNKWRIYCPGSGVIEGLGKGFITRWGAIRDHKKSVKIWNKMIRKGYIQ